jgi:tetratricopeptide (TPR) repeat protein
MPCTGSWQKAATPGDARVGQERQMKMILVSGERAVKPFLAFCLVVVFLSLLAGCLSTDQLIGTGLAHYKMGADGAAVPRLLQGVRELEQSNPTDPRLVTALIALGEMAASDKKYTLSEDFFRRALAKAESLQPPDDTLLRNANVSIGFFYLNRDRSEDAALFFERTLIISERNGSWKRTLYAVDLDNLAVARFRTNRFNEADDLSLKAIAILEGMQTDQEVAKHKGLVLSNLAYSYQKQGRNSEAETLFRRSLEILDPPGGPPVGEAWRIKGLRKVYADFLRQQNRNEEANFIERNLSRSEKTR